MPTNKSRLKRGINWTLRHLAAAPVRISLSLIATSIFVGGGLYSIFETDASYVDGMYWATVVLPTVGFGDFSPHTTPGRTVYEFVMAAGWVSTILMAGAVVSAIREHDIHEHHEMTAEIDDDLADLRLKATALVDGIERLSRIVDHDTIREATRKVHDERNGNA